jgi:Zn-dependent protease with chaperone function
MAESLEMLRRLAAAANVAVPRFEVGVKSPRLARLARRRDGFWIVFQPQLLVAPNPVRLFVVAHEISHIALGHPGIKRRLVFAGIAAIAVIGGGFFAILASQIVNDENPWLVLIESVIWLVVMLSPRAIILALTRRQEYQADRMAMMLLGSSDPGVAFFDWIANFTRPVLMPLPLRLWGSTHPSNVERRRALLGGAR